MQSYMPSLTPLAPSITQKYKNEYANQRAKEQMDSDHGSQDEVPRFKTNIEVGVPAIGSGLG